MHGSCLLFIAATDSISLQNSQCVNGYLNRHRRLRTQRVQHVEILAREHAAILVQKLHDRQRAAAAVHDRHRQQALGAVARVAVDLCVETCVVVGVVCGARRRANV